MAKTGILQKLFHGNAPVERRARSAEEIESWLRDRIASALRLDSDKIDPRQPFADYGLDSRTAVSISGELEEWLATEVPPTLMWDYPTIASAAAFLEKPISPANGKGGSSKSMSDCDARD